MKTRPFVLCDIVRETGFAIHRYHGPGHLEKIYENALVHRLRKRGVAVESQFRLEVHDEDGTLLGEFHADLLIERMLVIEIKAARAVAPEHVAQLLGYLRSARLAHGALLNFGAAVFHIKMYGMSEILRSVSLRRPDPTEDQTSESA
jgi:GxxExxY protein